MPWIWRAPARTAASELATALPRVVMGVDAEMSPGTAFVTSRDDALDLVRQRAAIGVAQHDPARAGLVAPRSAQASA